MQRLTVVTHSNRNWICHVIYGKRKPENIRDFASLEDVDGTLVGGASLEVREASSKSSVQVSRALSHYRILIQLDIHYDGELDRSA